MHEWYSCERADTRGWYRCANCGTRRHDPNGPPPANLKVYDKTSNNLTCWKLVVNKTNRVLKKLRSLLSDEDADTDIIVARVSDGLVGNLEGE